MRKLLLPALLAAAAFGCTRTNPETDDAYARAAHARIDASKDLDRAQTARQHLAEAQRDLQSALSKGDEEKIDAAQKKVDAARAQADLTRGAALEANRQARLQDHAFQEAQIDHAQRVNEPVAQNGVTVLPGTTGALRTSVGRVDMVHGGRVTVTADGKPLDFDTDDLTQVSLDGRLVPLKALKPGEDVRVAYTPGAGSQVARRIDATSSRADDTADSE